MKLRSVHFLLLLAASCISVSFSTNSDRAAYRIRTIVIDAGHGGKATGADGKYSLEKNVTLQVAMRLGKAVEEAMPDVKVVYTRTSDVFTENVSRSNLANQLKADLFISIHCNSMPKTMRTRTSVKGVETFVAGFGRIGEQDVAIRENADILLEKDYKEKYDGFDPNDPESYIIFQLMKNTFREQSIRLAALIQDEYIGTGRINRGVKEQNLLILQRCGMPAILTEIGFISNPQEEDFINSESGQNEIVSCLLKAIQAYKRLAETE